MTQLLNEDRLLTTVRHVHTEMEVALRVAELGSAEERLRHAKTIVGLVMGREFTVPAFQEIHRRTNSLPPSPGIAASLKFMAARLMIEQTTGPSRHLMAKLEVNKMEKRLIRFVKSTGMRPWPHSCEFIVGPYATPAQFAQVQARYKGLSLNGERSSTFGDPSNGFTGA